MSASGSSLNSEFNNWLKENQLKVQPEFPPLERKKSFRKLTNEFIKVYTCSLTSSPQQPDLKHEYLEQHQRQIQACMTLQYEAELYEQLPESQLEELNFKPIEEELEQASDISNKLLETTTEDLCLITVSSALTLKITINKIKQQIQGKNITLLKSKLRPLYHSFKVFKKIDPKHYDHKKIKDSLTNKAATIKENISITNNSIHKIESELKELNKNLAKNQKTLKKSDQKQAKKYLEASSKITILEQQIKEAKVNLTKKRKSLENLKTQLLVFYNHKLFLESISENLEIITDLSLKAEQCLLIWKGLAYKMQKIQQDSEKISTLPESARLAQEVLLIKELSEITKSLNDANTKLQTLFDSLSKITPQLTSITNIMRSSRID